MTRPPAISPRPLTRTQALQNAAFVAALERSGNIRLAARETGVAVSTLRDRRTQHPPFAQAWDAALAVAQARLNEGGGWQRPEGDSDGGGAKGANPARTRGGEAVVVRRRDGKLQVRRAQPGKITRAGEQMFLSALSATANVRLSAAAAGASVAAFYRRQKRHPGFAREMRLALQQGYERLEMALLAGFDADAHADDAWRHNAPPPIPPMTANQALQLLYLHHKTARLWTVQPHRRMRAGETSASGGAYAVRVAENWRAQQQRMHEDEAVRRSAAQTASTHAWHARTAAAADAKAAAGTVPPLPDLSQVTGWSKASGGAAHHEGVALFGGWRIGDMKGK